MSKAIGRPTLTCMRRPTTSAVSSSPHSSAWLRSRDRSRSLADGAPGSWLALPPGSGEGPSADDADSSRNDTLPAVPSLFPLPHGSSEAAEANPRQRSHSGSEGRRQRPKQLGVATRPPFRGRLGVRLQHLRDGATALSL